MNDLKKVYQALTLQEAEVAFLEFSEIWDTKYPLVTKSWERNWSELTTYFKYPPEIRRVIYTTNMIEGYHRQLRKIIYLATKNISQKWTAPIKDWGACISQFVIFFGDKVELYHFLSGRI